MTSGPSVEPPSRVPGQTDPVASFEAVRAAELPPPPAIGVSTPPRPGPAQSRRNRWWLPGVLVLVAAVVVAALVTFRPGTPESDREGGDSGQGSIGAGPGATGSSGSVAGGTGVPGGRSTPGTGGPGASAGAGASAGPGTNQAAPGSTVASTPVQRGTLIMTYQVVSLVLAGRVDIVIRNDSSTPATWHSVALRLEPITLGVTPSSNVSDQPVNGVHCLVPTGSGTVAAGDSVTITVQILGVYTRAAAGLDEAPCPM